MIPITIKIHALAISSATQEIYFDTHTHINRSHTPIRRSLALSFMTITSSNIKRHNTKKGAVTSRLRHLSTPSKKVKK